MQLMTLLALYQENIYEPITNPVSKTPICAAPRIKRRITNDMYSGARAMATPSIIWTSSEPNKTLFRPYL